MPKGARWPDNQTEELRRLVYDENLSDRECAARMGLTYSQVMNKRTQESWPSGLTLRRHTRSPRNEALEAIQRDPADALPVRPVQVEIPHLPPQQKLWESGFTSIHYSDTHFPYQNDKTLSVLYQLVRDLQPDAIIDHGDLLDCYSISRYEKDPANRVSLQDEIDAAARHLAILTALAPNARRKLIKGNHEDRLRRLLWSMAERQEAHQVLSLQKVRHALQWPVLLGLDAIGWEWHEDKVVFARRMILKHGTVVRKWSAYTAKGEYEKYGRCGMSGHTHRRGVFEHSDHNGTHAWWELGCCCQLNPGYLDDPDWQAGFNVVTWSKDRRHFGVEEVRVHNGVTYFRGKRYVAAPLEQALAEAA